MNNMVGIELAFAKGFFIRTCTSPSGSENAHRASRGSDQKDTP